MFLPPDESSVIVCKADKVIHRLNQDICENTEITAFAMCGILYPLEYFASICTSYDRIKQKEVRIICL